jgi:cyclopropane-fatty-acyl-phospholipid synthase
VNLARTFARIVGEDSPVRFIFFDGSKIGRDDAETVVEVRSPLALTYVVRSPGDLGLARAYVSGEIEIYGDIYTALRELTRIRAGSLTRRDRIDVLRAIGARTLLTPVKPPPEEVKLRGPLHSKARDRAAISHHYDVSNRFYELVLGPSMAYTCAVYPREDATLEEAQYEKFDLVCRKLGLQPGMRLLDVGCGWGGMVIHAAKHYGVRALGVTLSKQQAEYGQRAIERAGLTSTAEVRFADYRDVAEDGFDAISSIGLTEHIGKANLPAYFRLLHSKLRPGGRLLNHCITRPTNGEGSRLDPNGFTNRYVFPDGELESIGHITTVMQDNGFEVRHVEDFREHYAKTLAAWCANLDANWDEAVREAGLGRARVWALYMASSRLGFEVNHIELHQALGVKTVGGEAMMPLRPDW